MYLGYQNGKIKFYVEEIFDEPTIERWVQTDEEYVLNLDEYVQKDAEWEEEQAKKEKERIANLSLTKREVLLALFDDKGITPEQIKSRLDERGKIEFDYANEYFRGNPLINTLGAVLGYTPEQLDYLFEHKKFV